MISEESIQGSSAIYKSASINLLLTRNKLAENSMERNTTKMWLSKNRSTGVTGPCGELIYNNKNHKLYDSNDYELNIVSGRFSYYYYSSFFYIFLSFFGYYLKFSP